MRGGRRGSSRRVLRSAHAAPTTHLFPPCDHSLPSLPAFTLPYLPYLRRRIKALWSYLICVSIIPIGKEGNLSSSMPGMPEPPPDARARALAPYCSSPCCLPLVFLYYLCTNLRVGRSPVLVTSIRVASVPRARPPLKDHPTSALMLARAPSPHNAVHRAACSASSSTISAQIFASDARPFL